MASQQEQIRLIQWKIIVCPELTKRPEVVAGNAAADEVVAVVRNCIEVFAPKLIAAVKDSMPDPSLH